MEPFGVRPDIVTWAKPLAGGLPIGAVLVTEEIGELMKPGDHGTTFGGGPVACAAGNAVLDVLMTDGFMEDVQRKGDLLESILNQKTTGSPLSEAIMEVRRSGLMIGIQLAFEAGPVITACREAGVIVLSGGQNILRLLPPLIISDGELERGITMILECIQDSINTP